jgi:hypothetical protein
MKLKHLVNIPLIIRFIQQKNLFIKKIIFFIIVGLSVMFFKDNLSLSHREEITTVYDLNSMDMVSFEDVIYSDTVIYIDDANVEVLPKQNNVTNAPIKRASSLPNSALTDKKKGGEKNKTLAVQPKNNLTLLLEKVSRKEKLSDWDKFRYTVYKSCVDIKQKYPSIGATELQIYTWTMMVFYNESGYDIHAANPHSSARGLFQAMGNVRKRIDMKVGGDVNHQANAFVRYFECVVKDHKLDVSKINDAGDWYMMVFYPRLTTAPDWTVIGECHKGKKHYKWKSCVYHANAVFDANKDGKIVKAEVRNNMLAKHK